MAGAGAGAGAGAEIRDERGAGVGAENKQFWLRNTELFLCKFLSLGVPV